MPRQFQTARVSKEQALANRQITKQRIGKAVKTVGKVVSAPLRWAGHQIEKEFKIQDAQDEANRKKAKMMDEWYK